VIGREQELGDNDKTGLKLVLCYIIL